jgi:hypothetical protein
VRVARLLLGLGLVTPVAKHRPPKRQAISFTCSCCIVATHAPASFVNPDAFEETACNIVLYVYSVRPVRCPNKQSKFCEADQYNVTAKKGKPGVQGVKSDRGRTTERVFRVTCCLQQRFLLNCT